jgi:hypothetical protein
MSLQTLIRNYIQVHQGKHFVFERLIRDLLTEIAEKHSVDSKDLFSTCEQYLNRSSQVVKCQGRIMSKNGIPCTCPALQNELYCKRHLTMKEPVAEVARTRCVGETHDGSQCVRDAKPGQTLCGLHLRRVQNESLRSKERIPCAFYQDTDDKPVFCTQNACKNIWFCKSHKHLQPIYASVYKKANLSDYLNDAVKNPMIESLLKENPHLIPK